MTFDFNVNALISYLRENQLKPELQKETGQVFIVYQIKEFEVPVFFLMRPENSLMQMIAYLPYQLPEKTFGEVARMLHLFNRELDMPGFGMDESAKLMFYRCVLPCWENKIEKRLFNMCLGTTRVVCDTFMHAIGIIATGMMRVDEVVKDQKPREYYTHLKN
ncbi:MAG TPA: YbjN domain-containing protein [Waddliaceae bacterium]